MFPVNHKVEDIFSLYRVLITVPAPPDTSTGVPLALDTNARSLTVPLWMAKSNPGHIMEHVSASNLVILMLLSFDPVAMMSPAALHATQ